MTTKMTLDPDGTCSRDFLADLVGMNATTVSDLANKGTFIKAGRGRYDLRASIQSYVETLRRGQLGRPSANAELTAQKERLATAQANKIEMQNAQASGELIPVQDVKAEWLEIASDIRSRVLAVSSRVAAKLSMDPVATAALDDEIRRALGDIADSSNPPIESTAHDDLI